MEIWKKIKGFEKYEISNLGNVKSLNYNNTGKERLLVPQINKRGYRRVNLYKNNKAHQFLVGTLVAEHFLTKESSDFVPIHIKDKTDDSVKNLLYIPKKEALRRDYNITDKINNKKYKIDKKIYIQLKETAIKNGISSHRFHERIYRGWTLEESISIPLEREQKILNVKLYDFYGKLKSIKQLSKEYNITTKNIYKRLARGWNIYETVEIPLSKTNERRK